MRLKPIVLSIDDDLNFRKAIEIIMGRFGLNVKGVSTSQEFLEAAGSLRPDLYLIDLQLADSNGIELVKAIRDGLAPKAFTVVISGAKDPAIVAHAMEMGANDYILKPLDRVLLATKLAQFVDTEEIQKHRAEWTEPAHGKSPARLQFGGEITEVDELGVKLITSSLIPKGTVIKVGSELFQKFGAKDVLVTVNSTWLLPDSQRYGAYAEFDGADPEFLQALRTWLSKS